MTTQIFYPHYCNDCGCSYVAKERLAPCWCCHSRNVINCFRETMENEDEA